ncbi:MAG: NADH-quinone oxidoreductase subunit NuoE [Desulfobacterales bacterium]|nr:NADH-quinone oxidoreductase subunit NuoE [Desulfobacterales bacterium]
MIQLNRPQNPDIQENMWDKIDEIINSNKNKAGSVITVLRECQNIVGYLPLDLMDYIATGINIPASHIFGVATFYALFSLKPKGRHTIRVCMGTACYVKGIKEVMDRIEQEFKIKAGETTEDRRFSIEAVRCLGACGLAPVLVVDKDTHGGVSSDKIISILETYK